MCRGMHMQQPCPRAPPPALPCCLPAQPSQPAPPPAVVVDGDTLFTALIMQQQSLPGVEPYPRPVMRVGGRWDCCMEA